MSQLITATVKNFEAVHFKQSARLVSDVDLAAVKQKVLMRQKAFKAQNAVQSTSADTKYMSQVKRAFTSSPALNGVPQTSSAQTITPTVPATASAAQVSNQTEATPVVNVQQSVQAAYTQDRGSFEKRVASGEISYIPALSMTVITQLPSVEFEYLGGFNYVPPSSAPDGEHVNISL